MLTRQTERSSGPNRALVARAMEASMGILAEIAFLSGDSEFRRWFFEEEKKQLMRQMPPASSFLVELAVADQLNERWRRHNQLLGTIFGLKTEARPVLVDNSTAIPEINHGFSFTFANGARLYLRSQTTTYAIETNLGSMTGTMANGPLRDALISLPGVGIVGDEQHDQEFGELPPLTIADSHSLYAVFLLATNEWGATTYPSPFNRYLTLGKTNPDFLLKSD